MAYLASPDGTRMGPKPEPPVRRFKAYPGVPPLKDYSTTDLNNSVTGHLNASHDLSPTGSSAANRSTGSGAGRQYPPAKPTPTPRGRRFDAVQSSTSEPYSPLSHEVADITGNGYGGGRDPEVDNSRVLVNGHATERSQSHPRYRPTPYGDGARTPRGTGVGRVGRGEGGGEGYAQNQTPYSQQYQQQDQQNTPFSQQQQRDSQRPEPKESTPYSQNEVRSPDHQNTSVTSRLSYRDRWEQQRAAKVRRTSKDWSADRSGDRSADRSGDRSLDRSVNRSVDRSLDRSVNRSVDRSAERPYTGVSQIPQPAAPSRQIPEPATATSPPRATTAMSSRQEPEPATSTVYNRSILSSGRNQSLLSEGPNRSMVSEGPNRSMVSERNFNTSVLSPIYDTNTNVSRQRILTGEYRVHDPERSYTSARTRPLTPSDTRTPTSHNTTNGFPDSSSDHQTNTKQPPKPSPPIIIMNNKAVKEERSDFSIFPRNLLHLSRQNVDSSDSPNLTLYGNDWGVKNSLISLATVGGMSVIMGFMALILLFHLDYMYVYIAEGTKQSWIRDNATTANIMEAACTLTTFVLMLDLCCLMLCSMQCFFAAKLLKCPQGEER